MGVITFDKANYEHQKHLERLTQVWNFWSYGETQKTLENSQSYALAYVDAGSFIGFLLYSVVDPTCEVLYLFTLDAHRQHGIASQLFLALETERPPGMKIMLEVRADNVQALQFYKKKQMKIILIRPNYYKDGCDAYILEKK